MRESDLTILNGVLWQIPTAHLWQISLVEKMIKQNLFLPYIHVMSPYI